MHTDLTLAEIREMNARRAEQPDLAFGGSFEEMTCAVLERMALPTIQVEILDVEDLSEH